MTFCVSTGLFKICARFKVVSKIVCQCASHKSRQVPTHLPLLPCESIPGTIMNNLTYLYAKGDLVNTKSTLFIWLV